MKEHYYFDNASTTWPKPEPVYRFMDTFFRSHGVNPGRAGHTLAIEAEQMIFETRRLLAQFFGFRGDPNRVVFTQNVTDSLNIALFGLIGEGDHVITTRVEHNSVLRPVYHLERDHGVRVARVGSDVEGYVDPGAIRDALDPRTRVVVVNHGSNVLGSVQDLAAIATIAREAGAAFVVDTTQSAGVLAIDMDALGIDVLCFTGHKGLLGPMGIGGMIVADGVEIRHVRVGGTGVDSISEFQPESYPRRLEAGTGSIPGIAGAECRAEVVCGSRPRPAGRRVRRDHATACGYALAHIESVEVRSDTFTTRSTTWTGRSTAARQPAAGRDAFVQPRGSAGAGRRDLDATTTSACAPVCTARRWCTRTRVPRRSSARCGSPPDTSPTTTIWSTRSARSRTSHSSGVIRMEPGAVTIPHTHECMEEFLILEGELIESDGTVLKRGDFTSYRPGTRHNSRTETGCLLIGVDWDPPGPG